MRDPRQHPRPGDWLRSTDMLGGMLIAIVRLTDGLVWYCIRRDGGAWEAEQDVPISEWRELSADDEVVLVAETNVERLRRLLGMRWKAPQGDQRGA